MCLFPRILVFVLLTGFSLGLPLACQKSTSLSITAPVGQPVPAVLPERSLSTINVPITIPISVLEEQLNTQLPTLLYQDNDLEPDNLAVKVTKAGPLKITAEFSKLIIEIPLRVRAKGRWQWNACGWCKNIQKTEETTFDMVVRTESRLQIMPNYELRSYSTGDFIWGDHKPTLALGPLRINLAPFLEPRLRAQFNPLLLQLDQELQKRVNLKAYVQQAWQQLQQPVALHKGLDAWLALEPQAVKLTPLELKQNQINLLLGIETYVGVATGKKPVIAARQVPNLTPVRTLPPEARLEVTSDTPYPQLQQLLQKEIQHKTFPFKEGKHQLTVHDVAVSGSGHRLLLHLDVSGTATSGFFTKKFKGKIYLTALPYYHAASQSLKIKQVEFEVDTRDQLLKTADWLLHNTFRTQLEKEFSIPVKEQLTSLRMALDQGISQNQIQDRVLLTGKLTSFSPDTLFVTPTGVRAVFQATGNLAVQVN